jgi:hypothetical protein
MKKAAKAKGDPDMLAEYDFSQGVRGKYAQRYAEGTNVVVLSPDVAEYFPDTEAVNAALRALVDSLAGARRRRLPELRGGCAKPRGSEPGPPGDFW